MNEQTSEHVIAQSVSKRKEREHKTYIFIFQCTSIAMKIVDFETR